MGWWLSIVLAIPSYRRVRVSAYTTPTRSPRQWKRGQQVKADSNYNIDSNNTMRVLVCQPCGQRSWQQCIHEYFWFQKFPVLQYQKFAGAKMSTPTVIHTTCFHDVTHVTWPHMVSQYVTVHHTYDSHMSHDLTWPHNMLQYITHMVHTVCRKPP